MNEDRIRQAADLRQRGLSLRSIAAILGCSKDTVHRDLQCWEQQQVDAFMRQLEQAPGSQMSHPQVSDEGTVSPGDKP